MLKAGASDKEVDAVVTVADEKPLKFVATFDNSGTVSTGRFRTGIAMQVIKAFILTGIKPDFVAFAAGDIQRKNFADLGIQSDVLRRRIPFTYPTKVQSVTIPSIRQGTDVTIGAETGSGKVNGNQAAE